LTTRILFVCTGNIARSQMAESLARALAAPGVEIASAGTRPNPKGIHPLAVEAMRDRGIDISRQRSKSIDELPGEFDYVITLCDDAAQNCPTLSARRKRLHWSIADPALAQPGRAAELAFFRVIRDDIERRLRAWLLEGKLLKDEAASSLVARITEQLVQYEHPLFTFSARPSGDNVEVLIHFQPPRADIHTYCFTLHPREIENSQFPWTFQKQLYDCLHDYVIEMFTRNPQREN
jgi:arsenate reductase